MRKIWKYTFPPHRLPSSLVPPPPLVAVTRTVLYHHCVCMMPGLPSLYIYGRVGSGEMSPGIIRYRKHYNAGIPKMDRSVGRDRIAQQHCRRQGELISNLPRILPPPPSTTHYILPQHFPLNGSSLLYTTSSSCGGVSLHSYIHHDDVDNNNNIIRHRTFQHTQPLYINKAPK